MYVFLLPSTCFHLMGSQYLGVSMPPTQPVMSSHCDVVQQSHGQTEPVNDTDTVWAFLDPIVYEETIPGVPKTSPANASTGILTRRNAVYPR